MDCVNCGAPLPAKTTRCPYCQTLNDVDLRGRITVARGTTSRDCPRCRKKLTAVLLQVGADHLELDRCSTCHGLFFDPGEIESVLDGIETRAEDIDHRQLLTLIEEETPSDDFQKVTYVPCPDCGQLMNRRSFGQRSGVIVDSCRGHGIWLDGGELRRLIRWTQAGGRRHHAGQENEKKRLAAQLDAMPSTAETAAPLPERAGGSRPVFGGTGPFGAALDVVDVIDALGSLIKAFR